jgi:hypothetical protein
MTIKKFVAPALPTAPVEYDQRRDDQLNQNLRIYFNNLDSFLVAISTPQNGTTANRPTLNLQIGQFYFDTTLGYPVWWDGTYWVNALGYHPVSAPVTGSTTRGLTGTVVVTTP